MAHVTVLTPKDKAVAEYQLSEPIIDGGQKIEVLYFRKPNAGDLSSLESAARDGQIEADLRLIARLAGLLPEAAERIGIEDFCRIREGYESFFGTATKKAIEDAKANAMAVSAISSAAGSLATGMNG
jgi:hypothetical protein